jgi:3-hydroxyisobutyrate dehydrogenase-like beta-hydroxyacid dehydrogenase
MEPNQSHHNHRKTAGIIGLGIIGSRVAAALRQAGFATYVWNRSPKPEPNFLGSPAEVAKEAEIIQLFVADASATLAMIEAMRDALTPNHIVMCHGTIGLEGTLAADRMLREIGAKFLDAPFTGSKGAAEKGQLAYFIGGDHETFLRAKPVLEASAKSIVYIGEMGQAAVIKVVTNLISAATVQVLAEALAIVQRAGIDPKALQDAIEPNAMRSGLIDLKLPNMIAGNYEPHFSLKHMLKDVKLGMQLADWLKLNLPATGTIADVMSKGVSEGLGDMDYAVVAKAYERVNKATA